MVFRGWCATDEGKARQSLSDGSPGAYDGPVATYPPVTDRERDAALARITTRHLRREDTRWSEANSDSDTAAYDVLAYLRRRHTQLPVGLAADNVWDELTLSAWIYWDQRRRERELLHRALYLGLSLSDVGRYLGITTRQGTRDHLDRLDALLAEYAHIRATPTQAATGDGATDPLARFPGTTRASRGADVHTTRARRATTRHRPTRTDWITTHHDRIRTVITAVLTHTARISIHPTPDTPEPDTPDADGIGAAQVAEHDDPPSDLDDGLGDYLTWLAEDLATDDLDPATIATLGLALGELRTHPALTALPTNHGLRRALATADELRSDYAALRSDTHHTTSTGQ